MFSHVVFISFLPLIPFAFFVFWSPEKDVGLRTFKRILNAGSMPSTYCSWWPFQSATDRQRGPTVKSTLEELRHHTMLIHYKWWWSFVTQNNWAGFCIFLICVWLDVLIQGGICQICVICNLNALFFIHTIAGLTA